MNDIFTKNDVKKINLFKNLILKNNLPNKFLISCNNENKLKIFSLEIIKFLLCLEKKIINCQCNNCKLVNNENYYDLKIKGNFEMTIKKKEIQEIIENFNYSSLEKIGIKIYIINGIDLLTLEAINSLLKFLEEPPKNTYAFLLTKNKVKIIDTIKSRCLNIILDNTINLLKINNFEKKFIEIFFKNFEENIIKNFIHIRKLYIYNNFECFNFFLIIIDILKNKEWNNYKIKNKNLIEKLNIKNNKLIEICIINANLLLENLNKELILEKWFIDLYNEIQNKIL